MARKDNRRVFIAPGSRDKDGNAINPLDASREEVPHMTVELSRVKRAFLARELGVPVGHLRVVVTALVNQDGALYVNREDLEELVPFLQWCLEEMRAYDAKHGIEASTGGSVRFDKDD